VQVGPLIALALVLPILTLSFWVGMRAGRRRELSFPTVVLLVFLGMPNVPWSYPLIPMAYGLGFGWGIQPEYRCRRKRRLEIQKMRAVLQSDQLELHYQPIVKSSTGEIVAVEALCRWRQADGTWRAPGPWLDILLDPELAVEFADWCWRTALTEARRWPHVRLNVNVVAFRMEEPGWAQKVLGHLIQAGVSPFQITIEVTESMMLKKTPIVIENLQHLKAAGVHIALDDFGTEMANVKTLMDFPIDTIKIDKDLVQAADRDYAQVLIELGHCTGRLIVAEGVETEEQAAWLRSLGVDTHQGWLYHKAMPGLLVHGEIRKSWMLNARGRQPWRLGE